METGMMIDILKADRCTLAEAKRYLKNGNATIWEDMHEYVEMLKDCDCWEMKKVDYDFETEESFFEKIRQGCVDDTSIVECEGKEYLIEYAN